MSGIPTVGSGPSGRRDVDGDAGSLSFSARHIDGTTVLRHDPEYGLTELEVEGEILLVGQQQAPGQSRRLRIPARDVSVCRQRPLDSSILNILPVTLTQLEADGEARVMLRLALGAQYLLARITRKSASRLQLQVGDRLFAQIKSAALLMESADQHE